MVPTPLLTRTLLSRTLLAGAAASLSLGAATASPQKGAADEFFRAYYMEHERGDLEAALELYQAAIKGGSLTKAQRQEIESHLRACKEELAMENLASLVPADTIVYAELNDPGEQLELLLDQLGLMQSAESAGQIGISPRLVSGILGLKGAAVALTRVDPTAGMPGGVVILHPGDMDAVRGLIETALPAGGKQAKPIAGHPTFLVEDMVHVTMGERLIIASTERQLIEDTLRRVAGDRGDSLAANEDIAPALEGHGDNLFYFCANAEPVLPLLEGALGAAAGQSSEAALAIQLLDPTSLRTVSGSIGVHGDGLALDLGLTLDEDHENLAFNFLRMPHVSPSTFELVPEGVAAFLATSLNERNPGGTGVTNGSGEPVVTVMDLGREVFGNLVDVALFTLPSMSEGPGGMPLPDAALAMSVNDPKRSHAIWSMALGLAQGASGSGRMEARTERVNGHGVERFQIDDVSVYLYAKGDQLIVSPSLRAIEAATSGRSVTGDALFGDLAQGSSADHTSVLGVSVGRLAQIAAQVMPEEELSEAGPVLELLTDTSVIAKTRHSDSEIRWSAKVTGLPNVGPLVQQLVHAEIHGGPGPYRADQPMRTASDQGSSKGHDAHQDRDRGAASHQLAVGTGSQPLAPTSASSSTERHFQTMLAEGNLEAAAALLPVLASAAGSDPMAQNDFVWNLISGEHGAHLAEALLPTIEGAVEATGAENWYVLDTMAHVQFEAGDIRGAIRTERKAVSIATKQSDERGQEAKAALSRFMKAAKQELLR